ncbi:MAG: hypothetical protein MAG451_01247 [Anaerolineales bacterium]|nr:hypothetical protein [Anaerolineales bacterium]
MSPYLAVSILAGIALLQTTLAPYLAFRGAQPDFMLLAVVSWSLLRGGRAGAVWGFVGGLLLELLSGGPFGVLLLPLVVLGYLSGLGEINVLRAHFLLPGLVILVATLLYDALILILLQLLGQPVVWGPALLNLILPAALLNALTLPFFYLPFRRAHQTNRQPQMKW